ncbi:lipoprotein Spr [Volucribacter psittacicida]|uniref:Lipoprotein Spr n=1 Tax=Volucribacter psittacicida TaxID=203482 RepID=A0A4R1FRU9_9PAST|nr:NlpC/P60 family protein [Volucribacter psittacicida]TCJ96199.1 lipoprotein Spr [Volucribacter psittacicida]
MLKKLFIIIALLLLSACNAVPPQTNIQQPKSQLALKTNKASHPTLINNAQLAHLYQQWVGTKYRLGGTTKNGIDCSAFMQQIFAQIYQIDLPRSTSQQRQLGKSINKEQLQQGDLVFFRHNHHVGLYIGENKFMHASTSQGVTISSLNDHYWRKNYTQSRRILLSPK